MGMAIVTNTIVRSGLTYAEMFMGLEEMPEHSVYRTEYAGYYFFVYRCSCTGEERYAFCRSTKGIISEARPHWVDSHSGIMKIFLMLDLPPTLKWDQMEVATIQQALDELERDLERTLNGDRTDSGQSTPASRTDDRIASAGDEPTFNPDREEDAATRAARAWHQARNGGTV